jgi:hypothetical protein
MLVVAVVELITEAQVVLVGLAVGVLAVLITLETIIKQELLILVVAGVEQALTLMAVQTTQVVLVALEL